MKPPPIRYPLPTLLALLLVGYLAWSGRAWIDRASKAVQAGIDRLASGPPVPASEEPMILTGSIPRRGLVAEPGVEATDLPDGQTVETIRYGGFFDLYDRWPLEGEATHYRIGNREPIGWVDAEALLPWSTRLVLKAPAGEPLEIPAARAPGRPLSETVELRAAPLPVLTIENGWVELAVWEPDGAWRRVERRLWVEAHAVPAKAWAVLLSRDELLETLRVWNLESADADPTALLVRALLGRLTRAGADGTADASMLEVLLPPEVREKCPSIGRAEALERLARLNENWVPDATWSGLEFRAIPLSVWPR